MPAQPTTAAVVTQCEDQGRGGTVIGGPLTAPAAPRAEEDDRPVRNIADKPVRNQPRAAGQRRAG